MTAPATLTDAELDEIESKVSIALHHLTKPEFEALVAMARRTAETEEEETER